MTPAFASPNPLGPDGIRIYRRVKAALAAVLAAGALATVGARQGHPRTPLAPLKSTPVASLREAMETTLPLHPLPGDPDGDPDAPRPLGSVTLAGQGPPGADATLTQNGREIVRFELGKSGRWRADVPVESPGDHEFRATYARDGVDAGRSRPYRARFGDPEANSKPRASTEEKPSDRSAEVEAIRITNLAPGNKVETARLVLRGIAPPGDTLNVYMDATHLGRAEAKLSGRWEFRPKVQALGPHTFTVEDQITLRRFGPLPLLLTKSGTP